jgi:hypothetical protein
MQQRHGDDSARAATEKDWAFEAKNKPPDQLLPVLVQVLATSTGTGTSSSTATGGTGSGTT